MMKPVTDQSPCLLQIHRYGVELVLSSLLKYIFLNALT